MTTARSQFLTSCVYAFGFEITTYLRSKVSVDSYDVMMRILTGKYTLFTLYIG